MASSRSGAIICRVWFPSRPNGAVDAGFLMRFLKAAKVLRDAVNERAFHIEDVTREHAGLAKSEEYPVTAREIATGSLRAARPRAG